MDGTQDMSSPGQVFKYIMECSLHAATLPPNRHSRLTRPAPKEARTTNALERLKQAEGKGVRENARDRSQKTSNLMKPSRYGNQIQLEMKVLFQAVLFVSVSRMLYEINDADSLFHPQWCAV